MVFNRETNKSPRGIKAWEEWLRTIDEDSLCQGGVIQKLHESHHFICCPLFLKKLSQEPIGQHQPPLGINTQTTHRRAKLQLQRVEHWLVSWTESIPPRHGEAAKTQEESFTFQFQHFAEFQHIPGGPPNISAVVRFITALTKQLWCIWQQIRWQWINKLKYFHRPYTPLESNLWLGLYHTNSVLQGIYRRRQEKLCNLHRHFHDDSK